MITTLFFGLTAGFMTGLLRLVTAVLPSANPLPWGLEGALTSFSNIIVSLIYYMPWLEVIWHVFVLALIVKVVLLIVQMFYFALKLIRG